MASRSPHPTSYHHPDQSSRPKPRLQTSGSSIQSQTRYSYLETPVEMQRSTFAPFSSPTNSVIDESPVSPISPARNLPGYPQHDRATPIPEEKAMQVNMQVPPPQLHPAFYAPIAAESASAAPRQYSQPTQSPEPHQPASPLPLKLHHDDGQASTQLITPPTSPHSKKTDLVHLETYNPHSLQGPNVGIANHQPGQVSHPNAVVDPNWKHSLCEADPLCCMGLFCPCMLYGRTMYRLSRKAEKKDGSNLLGYESCNGGCGLFALACGFQGILAAIHRTRIRKLYKIEGGFGSDCVRGIYCCCCVVAQNEREVKEREELIRRYSGPATGAYMPTAGMAYAPPPR